MKVKNIKVGGLQTNCYILVDEKSNEAVVIDPGDEAGLILPEIAGLKVKYIILTHGHYDHVGGVLELKAETQALVLMNDQDNWAFKAEQNFKDGDEIKFGSEKLKVIATPGHTAGCVCFYSAANNSLFSGDTLFYNTYGRVDLQSSSPRDMVVSLKKLATLPDETEVFPGHGQPTTIKQEKEIGTLD
ncbi:MAG: MBL fold metallo-hydrolase [bacterium]|nr:MBL fold metallo-hydrolase [Candidatus Margulisiibacteriota bacterium]